jgi:hypothetical protein
MNAVKFFHHSTAASGGSTNLTATATLGSYSGSINLQLSISTSPTAPTQTLQKPYSSSGCQDCSSSLKEGLLSSKGGKELSFPFDNYIVNSPVRPLCRAVAASKATAIGDISVSPLSGTVNVLANGWLSLDSSLVYPEGFTPIKFTGSVSKDGVISSAIKFTADGHFTLISPQVHADYIYGIGKRTEVGALVYSQKNGTWWYLPATEWNTNSNLRNRLSLTVPGSSSLIFGYLNTTTNTLLPGYLDQTMDYLSDWSGKMYEFSGSENLLRIDISSQSVITKFKIADYSLKVISNSKTTVLKAYAIVFEKKDEKVATLIKVMYPNSSTIAGHTWG